MDALGLIHAKKTGGGRLGNTTFVRLTQNFFDNNPDAPPEPELTTSTPKIDETNLADRISMALNTYRRQKDHMADIMDQMKRIVSGG